MSQYSRRVDGGTPAVPTQFTADDATTAIPAGNNLNVFARGTTDDRAEHGVQTTSDPDNGDNLFVELTNRVYGTGTSVNGATVDLITFALDGANPQVYRFNIDIVERETTSGDGSGYTMMGTIKTDGAAATIIEVPFQDVDEDVSLNDSEISFVANGNNAILQATGVAGLTVSYAAYGYYIQV